MRSMAMSSSKYFDRRHGRWKEIDLETGRVSGWARTRFVYTKRGKLYVAGRRDVLARLQKPSQNKPTTVREGFQLPQTNFTGTVGSENFCKELEIDETDIKIFRKFVENDDKNIFNVDLFLYDECDSYKQKMFYKIKPLVKLVRDRNIRKILLNNNNLRLNGEVKNKYRMRKRENKIGSDKVKTIVLDIDDNELTHGGNKITHSASEPNIKIVEFIEDTDSSNNLVENKSDINNRKRTRVGDSRSNVKSMKKRSQGNRVKSGLDSNKFNGYQGIGDDNPKDSGINVESSEKKGNKQNVEENAGTKRIMLKPVFIKEVGVNSQSRVNRDFSILEDESVVEWILKNGKAHCVKGNKMWKVLEPIHSSITGQFRTWKSLRNRYLQYILPSLGSLSLSLAQATALRAAASADEPSSPSRLLRSNTRLLSPSQGNLPTYSEITRRFAEKHRSRPNSDESEKRDKGTDKPGEHAKKIYQSDKQDRRKKRAKNTDRKSRQHDRQNKLNDDKNNNISDEKRHRANIRQGMNTVRIDTSTDRSERPNKMNKNINHNDMQNNNYNRRLTRHSLKNRKYATDVESDFESDSKNIENKIPQRRQSSCYFFDGKMGSGNDTAPENTPRSRIRTSQRRKSIAIETNAEYNKYTEKTTERAKNTDRKSRQHDRQNKLNDNKNNNISDEKRHRSNIRQGMNTVRIDTSTDRSERPNKMNKNAKIKQLKDVSTEENSYQNHRKECESDKSNEKRVNKAELNINHKDMQNNNYNRRLTRHSLKNRKYATDVESDFESDSKNIENKIPQRRQSSCYFFDGKMGSGNDMAPENTLRSRIRTSQRRKSIAIETNAEYNKYTEKTIRTRDKDTKYETDTEHGTSVDTDLENTAMNRGRNSLPKDQNVDNFKNSRNKSAQNSECNGKDRSGIKYDSNYDTDTENASQSLPKTRQKRKSMKNDGTDTKNDKKLEIDTEFVKNSISKTRQIHKRKRNEKTDTDYENNSDTDIDGSENQINTRKIRRNVRRAENHIKYDKTDEINKLDGIKNKRKRRRIHKNMTDTENDTDFEKDKSKDRPQISRNGKNKRKNETDDRDFDIYKERQISSAPQTESEDMTDSSVINVRPIARQSINTDIRSDETRQKPRNGILRARDELKYNETDRNSRERRISSRIVFESDSDSENNRNNDEAAKSDAEGYSSKRRERRVRFQIETLTK